MVIQLVFLALNNSIEIKTAEIKIRKPSIWKEFIEESSFQYKGIKPQRSWEPTAKKIPRLTFELPIKQQYKILEIFSRVKIVFFTNYPNIALTSSFAGNTILVPLYRVDRHNLIFNEENMEYEQVYQGNLVEIFRISDYFYFRRANLPVRYQCNGAFIVGKYEVAIVDVPPEGTEMLDEIEKLFKKPVSSIFLTHNHRDHAEGLASYLDFPLNIYCCYRALDYLVPVKEFKKANFFGVRGNLKLEMAEGIKVELITLDDTAHSKGDMLVKIPELGIVCAGDVVVEYKAAYFQTADIHSWIGVLRNLAEEKSRYVLSGHGPSLFPSSYISEFADFLSVIEKTAKICFDRIHPELIGKGVKAERERFTNISTDKVRELVETYFSERDGNALFLEKKAGDADARREVRMALWSFIRERLV
jgi:glyoxylase-like metal-dependent hydrolase (beta-lactamase superfamily II)